MGMPIITSANIDRDDAITDIVQSVALEQAALSHILNAEGEKIQWVIAGGYEPETVLETNKSVRSMVESVTRLEMVLQSKLGLFEDNLNRIMSAATTTADETKQEEVVEEAEEEETVSKAEAEPETADEPEPERTSAEVADEA